MHHTYCDRGLDFWVKLGMVAMRNVLLNYWIDVEELNGMGATLTTSIGNKYYFTFDMNNKVWACGYYFNFSQDNPLKEGNLNAKSSVYKILSKVLEFIENNDVNKGKHPILEKINTKIAPPYQSIGTDSIR